VIENTPRERIRPLSEVAVEYSADYKVRHRFATFAEYAVGHATRCSESAGCRTSTTGV
jgi:hypothetical protein